LLSISLGNIPESVELTVDLLALKIEAETTKGCPVVAPLELPLTVTDGTHPRSNAESTEFHAVGGETESSKPTLATQAIDLISRRPGIAGCPERGKVLAHVLVIRDEISAKQFGVELLND
jgi:hypothetical protein